jgi:transcription elongation factor GreA
LKEAIAYGDLSENAEYDEAKNQQAFIEGRIMELEDQIKNAEVVEGTTEGIVQIGSTVTLQRVGDSEKHEYTIVGSTEADALAHKISNESPVGEAILGKKNGDKVKVSAPGGEYEYIVMKVS